jgi:hypothetical protein
VCMCGACMCGVCMFSVCMCGVCMCGVCMCGVCTRVPTSAGEPVHQCLCVLRVYAYICNGGGGGLSTEDLHLHSQHWTQRGQNPKF